MRSDAVPDLGPASGLNPAGNPLSPANGSYIAPWARAPGRPGGPKAGNKFDLTTFDKVRRLAAATVPSVTGRCSDRAGPWSLWGGPRPKL